MKRSVPQAFLATCLLLFGSSCGHAPTKPIITPPPGSGTIVHVPMPTVVITPWVRPTPVEPITLGLEVMISNTGAAVYLPGTSPSQSRVVVTASDDGVIIGTQTVDFDPSGWKDGAHTVSLTGAAQLIAKSTSVSFEVFINAQIGTDVFVRTDKEP